MKRILSLGLLTFFILPLAMLPAEESFNGYHQADTAHFTFVFDKDSKAEAQRFARYADSAWQNVARIYGMPQDKTKVLMTSNTDVINAFAMSDTFYMGMYTNPNNIVDFGFRTDWHELFFTHELIHIANMNFENRRPDWINHFGSFLPLLDTSMLPGYALEGLTTVLETELTAGGRGRSPYFELFYKAPAMENNMVDYYSIGSGNMMPTGQIYVYGYVISRAIADLYGVAALADIERNRSLFGSWEDAVWQVTNKTPEYIFNDAKKALDKRYARERSIPEGVTLTPHYMGKSYYPKAVIQEDKSIISLAGSLGDSMSVVQYNPETLIEETLFKASFNSDDGFTASGNGIVVFTNTTTTDNKQPGNREITDLYIWDDMYGMRQLTNGTSYFQPAMSRRGNRLVATEIVNGQYRIVEISLETGTATVILESPDKSYIQPSLSDNGNYLTCLELTGTHAAVAVCSMPSKENPNAPLETLRRVYNDVPETATPTEIMDPAYPAFVDGCVTFCSNERGRLEIFECDMDGSNLRPVVSDPVGALWCYKLHKYIYYGSYSSTGYVVKVKPITAWGEVPDFEGPSKPGEIISFADGLSDYPDFKPYMNSRSYYEERSETLATQAYEDTRTVTDFENERRYVDLPHLLLAYPDVTAVSNGNSSYYYGFGLGAVGMSHMMQENSRMSLYQASADYYPGLQQITGNLLFTKMRGSHELFIDAYRTLTATTDQYAMTESTGFLFSYTLPLYSSYNYFHTNYLSLIATSIAQTVRVDTAPFGISADIPYTFNGQASVELETTNRMSIGYDNLRVNGGISATYTLQPSAAVNTFVYEADTTLSYEKNSSWYGLNIKGRWFDLPEQAAIPQTVTTLNIGNVSCLYPGRLIGDISVGSYSGTFLTTLYVQRMVSFGKSSYQNTPVNTLPLNLTLDPETYIGAEAGMLDGRTKLVAGIVMPYSSLKSDSFDGLKFYISLRLNGLKEHISEM